MYIVVTVLAVVLAVFLILIVLVQNSKGGGLSSEFGGANTSQMFGVKKTTDLLEQITWGFAGGIVVLSMASYIVVKSTSSSAGGINSANIEKAQTAPAPAGGLVAPPPPVSVENPAGEADTTK